jgi:hypothetical protein
MTDCAKPKIANYPPAQSLRHSVRGLRFVGMTLAASRMHGVASNPYVEHGLAGSAYLRRVGA